MSNVGERLNSRTAAVFEGDGTYDAAIVSMEIAVGGL